MLQPDTLTRKHDYPGMERDTLVDVADQTLIHDEFVVAYEAPITGNDYVDSRRGYVTIWVRDTDGYYRREQMKSGDDAMIRQWFGEMAEHGTDRITDHIPT